MSHTPPASRTAILTAAYRARHPELCRDPWAAKLAGPEGEALARRYDQVNPHAGLYTAVRTAFLDGEVRAALARGVDQVVLLGAGLDARAARLGAPGVRFFEVDRPASQEDKLARARAAEGYPLDAATYVPCELGRDDFLAGLEAAGLSAARPALVLWEGITFYLTEEAVRATLRRVAEGLHPRSALLFDYVEKRLVEGRSTRPADRELLELLAAEGEPFRWGTNDVTALLYEEGYRHVRTVSFDQACLSLTGTWERERAFRFQHLALASRTPPEEVLASGGGGR